MNCLTVVYKLKLGRFGECDSNSVVVRPILGRVFVYKVSDLWSQSKLLFGKHFILAVYLGPAIQCSIVSSSSSLVVG